jgi:hypothetical protein
MNLTALVNKPKTAGVAPASKEIWWTHAQHVTSGPLAYGDDFGRIPIVETTSVHKLTDDIKNRRIRRAKKLLQRRRGLIKYLDFDALPLYWLEPDDRVRIPPAVGHYDFYIQRIEFDLAGGPMRCRTRTMSAVWD